MEMSYCPRLHVKYFSLNYYLQKQQQSGNNRNDFREDLLKPFITPLTSLLVKLCCELVEGLDLEAREMAQWATCLPHKCEDLRLTPQSQQKLDVAVQVSVILAQRFGRQGPETRWELVGQLAQHTAEKRQTTNINNNKIRDFVSRWKVRTGCSVIVTHGLWYT